MVVLQLNPMVHVSLLVLAIVKKCDITFYVAPVNAQAILDDCVQLDLVKRESALQPELLTENAIRLFKGLAILGLTTSPW